MPEGGSVRQRKKRATTPVGGSSSSDEDVFDKAILENKKQNKKVVIATKPVVNQSQERQHKVAFAIITLLAFATRFYKIQHPDEVVFDEVHFGKFASYYLQRTYFFDVHPPFGKLLFALMGWFVGFSGHFLFDNIGDSYITNKVPYVAFRSMPALMGSLTVSVVYLIMWESGYAVPAALVASGLVLLDNAHVGETRLILLDAVLVLSMATSLLSYIKFYKQRHDPFGRKWWKWLLLTGISMSCVISTKYVGVFTFVTVGSAVAIDLWGLLDVKRGLSMQEFGRHLGARAFGLVVVPFLFYLFWFQVHFTVLYRSGPGDEFMSPEFQETLADNVMTQASLPIYYYDTITLKHKETRALLHSHPNRYPLRYEDGRISSEGQQVTGYPFNDTNNHWVIEPTYTVAEGNNYPVKHSDLVRLKHVVTDTYLLSHDVASPYYPTNQEFTTTDRANAFGAKENFTKFEIKIENGKPNQDFRSMSGHFKLIHFPSKVAMWTHTKPLPEWGFKQQEINGNKNTMQTSNIWYVEDIPSMPLDDVRRNKVAKKTKSIPFFKKYFELQKAMFHHNNALTSSHPYASHPITWPFLLRGVSFWTKNDTRQQIYFVGNPLGWWITAAVLAVFAGIMGAEQLTRRRGIDALDHRTRSRLYNSTGFFFVAWMSHYLAFYVMGRQLFLHHYLPAHLASSLVTGALIDFIFNSDNFDETVPAHIQALATGKAPTSASKKGKAAQPSSPTPTPDATIGSWIATAVIYAILTAGFVYFAPLTYGTPGLEIAQVNARKWMNFDLHFAK